MKHVLIGLLATFCFPFETVADDVSVKGWKTVVLWESEVVSARLLHKPTASMADKCFLALELENHTERLLKIGQTWMNLEMTLKEVPSGKIIASTGLSGVFPSIKELKPGRHRFFGDTLESASGNLGLPPKAGLRIEVQANVDSEVVGGERYHTPDEGRAFKFEWKYPSATELDEMILEMKKHLRATDDLKKNLFRIHALFKVPQVRDGQTVEDFLLALNASHDFNVRNVLVPNLFVKHADAPKVLAYYRKAFQQVPDIVYSDALTASVWNEEFLEPLVQGYEKGKSNYFDVLSRHSTEWRDKSNYVGRISTVFLKRHPIIRRDVRSIPDEKIEEWAKAVNKAGAVADPALVELLRPALAVKRKAWINYGAGGWNKKRICDRALIAILEILDGDSWKAFEAAGIKSFKVDDQEDVYDRVIGLLNKRLESRSSKD